MKIIRFVIFIIPTIILFGCASAKEETNTDTISNSVISMEEFSKNNNLEIENAAGGYLFSKSGVRLYLYPHVKYVRYNGRTIDIPDAPFVADGRLYLPLSIIERLPDSFSTSKSGFTDLFVLIDPGHGGEDTGAISGAVLEKDIVLDISRRIQRNLANNGIQSKLTRDQDYFVTLDERSRIANRHPGAIFVSVHANAERSGTVEGIETFYLSSKISDNQRAKWAATEYDFNTAAGALNPTMEILAATKMSRDIRSKSRLLAESVHSSIIQDLSEPDRGVKQENFSVLRESFFGPAILIETGFITHAKSRNKLSNANYRERMANDIVKGIITYASER